MKKFLLFFIFFSSAVLAMTPEQQEALVTHNKFRSKHAAPALKWDDALARYAARYAARCHFKHSHGGYGENLAAGFPSAATAIQAWYGEHKFYRGGYSSATGHFTQMVWKSSRKLGCAIAACDGKNGTPGKFLVCEYSPAGNVLSRKYFAENIS